MLKRTVENWDRALLLTVILMVGILVPNLAGLLLDSRLITGSPAWLKPAKFAISVIFYAGTLAWLLSKITVWRRWAIAAGHLTAVMLMVEIFVIDLQAWRGTSSHFNFQTKLDGTLFAIMGVSIALLWIASVVILAALFRQPFANRPLGWALRLGMLITVLGSASGGLMTRPMPNQPAGIIGAHTVGAPDGGKGMPGTGWSTSHGDLRIAHFIGLHGIQAIPLLYLLLSRRRKARVSTIAAAAASYLGIAVLIDWQALRGQSLLQPDSLTIDAWFVWLLLSTGAVAATMWPSRYSSTATAGCLA